MRPRVKLYTAIGFALLFAAIFAAGQLLEYGINIIWVTVPLVLVLLYYGGP
jgi:hypothetical protein